MRLLFLALAACNPAGKLGTVAGDDTGTTTSTEPVSHEMCVSFEDPAGYLSRCVAGGCDSTEWFAGGPFSDEASCTAHYGDVPHHAGGALIGFDQLKMLSGPHFDGHTDFVDAEIAVHAGDHGSILVFAPRSTFGTVVAPADDWLSLGLPSDFGVGTWDVVAPTPGLLYAAPPPPGGGVVTMTLGGLWGEGFITVAAGSMGNDGTTVSVDLTVDFGWARLVDETSTSQGFGTASIEGSGEVVPPLAVGAPGR
jgi:hypothetical protein